MKRTRKKRWHVRNKWKRHLALVRSRMLNKHIPRTRLLKKNNLKKFLARYRVVFIKPVYGSFGNRIMKITKRRRSFLVQKERRVRKAGQSKVSRIVFRHVRKQPFMIQRGVSLMKIKGHPADFRLLMLRPGRRWRAMGIMGKRAAGNLIVTNFHHGGKPARFRASLRRAGWSNAQINRVRRRIYRIGRQAAVTFSSRYRHCRRLGIDIAIDARKRTWILEVNTNPFFDLFRYHADKSRFRKIRRYMRIIRKRQSAR